MKKTPTAPRLPTASKKITSSKANTDKTESSSKWIRIDRPFPIPSYVKEALQKLNEAGHIAYVVGGSVRDFLLGKEVKDHDIATSADPDELCKLFPKSVTVGKAFGVIKVPTGTEPPLLEIATFRQDLEYRDHRHPKGVVFSSPLEDAQRRDFTINALFYDPKTSRILDAFNGVEDLRAGIVRAIGDPKERFREDALRLLRAVRFTTRFGFRLDEETAAAVLDRSKLISKVSAERIRDELNLMWMGPRPEYSLQLLLELGLIRQILPELESLRGLPQSPLYHHEGDVWFHLLKRAKILAEQNPKRPATLVWAAVLLDVGKPVASKRNGGKNFNGYEIDGAKIAAQVMSRLKMSRAESEQVVALVGENFKMRDVFKMRESTLQRFIREPHFEELLALHRADAIASDGNLAFYEFSLSRLNALRQSIGSESQRLIDGTDLIQLGFQPGPEFSRILRVVEDLSLEKTLKSKEQALEYVVKHFVK